MADNTTTEADTMPLGHIAFSVTSKCTMEQNAYKAKGLCKNKGLQYLELLKTKGFVYNILIVTLY